jgi:hypothetical protein
MVRCKARPRSRNALFILNTGILVLALCPGGASGQQFLSGFAVERFYPSAPGAGWFVMDDLNISGGLGGAIEVNGGYARNALVLTSANGTNQLALVSGEGFIDIGLAVTYDRYRAYVNMPIPLAVTGNSGTVGAYQFNGPAVSPGTNPDTIADPRIGFDARLLGRPEGSLRLGVSAQLIFPSGNRADYVTDNRYRGMFRLLAAGDWGAWLYAGQVGVHVRPLKEPAPGTPDGSEFLFGGSVGRKIPVTGAWGVVIGPEFWGETAFASFFSSQQTGVEGLITSRFEKIGAGPHLRVKLGIGHDVVQHFGAPQWRVLVSLELLGQSNHHL